MAKHELYGLTGQKRECSATIGANIAEGCGEARNNEFQRYLQIASGSDSEPDDHLLLSRDLGYLPEAEYWALIKQLRELSRMSTSLLQKTEPEPLMAKC